MAAILYYLTGHGFGHAVRSLEVARRLMALRPQVAVHVRGAVPQWLVRGVEARLVHTGCAIDVGMVQGDSLELDIAATLAAWERWRERSAELIERELAYIRANEIALVLGDIPPLAFELAARAAIPSIAIANFTWSAIYSGYVEAHPGFRPLIEEIDGQYRRATLALALPYSCAGAPFERIESIPWIARRSVLSREEARRRLGLPPQRKAVLLSFGGLGLRRLPWEELRLCRDYLFITTGDDVGRRGNLLTLPPAQHSYADIIRAADVIVTKPGYGIVADAIAHRVAVLYTDRGDFAEYPRLVQALRECATAEFIPRSDLLAGNLVPYLERLLAREPHWPEVALDGAAVAARRILDVLDGRPG
ncbi:MAG TPA: hypothetical protein VNN77_11000 [candidate division Zixibacteria bacterium]|nr:hypothetical protein [candidate division Zixibacteria bacterium]